MIYNYPFFRFPYSRGYNPNYYNSVHLDTNSNHSKKALYNNSTASSSAILKNHNCIEKEKKASSKSFPSSFSFLNNFLHQEDRNESEWCLEFLGIKLYYDDILLLSLIYFLYKEDVKDQYLFIALILLLLS